MPIIPILIPALESLSARMQSVCPHHRRTLVAALRNTALTCLQKVRQGPSEEKQASEQEEQPVRERSLQHTCSTLGLARLTLPKCQPLSTASSCGSSRPFASLGRGTGGLDMGRAS
jgi:hypothetical protein